jgi:hypothetical protein
MNSIIQSGASFIRSSEQQIEQLTNKKSSKIVEMEQSQNYYLQNSHLRSHYVEKDVIVEDIDDSLSARKVPSDLRSDNSHINIYRGSANNENYLDQSYHSNLPVSEFKSPAKNPSPIKDDQS